MKQKNRENDNVPNNYNTNTTQKKEKPCKVVEFYVGDAVHILCQRVFDGPLANQGLSRLLEVRGFFESIGSPPGCLQLSGHQGG